MRYLHIIDRSNLDEVVAIKPMAAPAKNIEITRREDLSREPSMPRADIILYSGHYSDNQYALYVAEHGFSGDIFLLDVLTEEELTRVKQIAERMRNNAYEFPPAKKLICN